MARYNPDGSLDTSLGGDGIVITDVEGRDEGRDVVLDSFGRIIVSGYAGGYPGTRTILPLCAITPTGVWTQAFPGTAKRSQTSWQ